MLTFIFLVTWGLGTILPLIIFDLLALEWMTLLYGLITFIAGLIIAIVVIVIILMTYGRFQKTYDPMNQRNHAFIDSLIALVKHILRVKVEVTGEENIPKDKNFILVSNHQENYDIILLKPFFKGRPMVFIAKQSLFNIPLIGRLAKIMGNVPIYRESDRSAVESIIKGIKIYKQGAIVSIFPEGTRSRQQSMGPFKAGAFKLAMKPKADILVSTLYNVHNVFKWWPFKRQVIKIHFHPVMTYEDYKDLNTQALSNHIRDMIQNQIETFNEL